MFDIYVLGLLYPEPETDENGDAIANPNPILGYHVNTTQSIAEFKQFEIKPKVPMSAVGGVKTFYYKFSNKEQFEQYLGLIENYNLIEVLV